MRTVREIAGQYPAPLRAAQEKDVRRIADHLHLVLACIAATGRNVASCSLMDVGGGIGMFSVACRALGLARVVLVDDFRDPVNEEIGTDVLALHRSYGVEVVTRDVAKDGLPDVGSGFDIISFFDTIEHWHRSPKRTLHQALSLLKPDGWLVIGVPNCVNLRKRITVPFGYGKWTQMADWYERERFRGHVREPDVQDLWYIARDLGLRNVSVEGRNWAGYFSTSRFIRWATRLGDRLLRLRPSLCSDLYLVGQKG